MRSRIAASGDRHAAAVRSRIAACGDRHTGQGAAQARQGAPGGRLQPAAGPSAGIAGGLSPGQAVSAVASCARERTSSFW